MLPVLPARLWLDLAKVGLATVLCLCLMAPAFTQTEQTDNIITAPVEKPPALEPGGEVTLNFRNVDIRQFIESISELTGKNFLIDPRVGGRVTIIGNTKVPQEELYDVMLSIFTMYGLRAVPASHDITRIIPASVAPKYPLENKDTSDLVTEILQIHFLDAPAVVPLIKPFMTPEAQVIVHKPTNQLIVTEVRNNLAYVKQIMNRLDVSDVGQFEIINLDNMKAKEVVALVQKAGNRYIKGLVQLVADEKNDRVIMTGPSNARLPLRALIVEVDTSQNVIDPVSSIRVIPLRYAKVTDVEKIVKGVLSSSSFLSIYGGEGAYILDEDGDQPKDTAEPEQTDESKAEDDEDDRVTDERIESNKRNFTIHSDRATNSLVIGGPEKILKLVISLVKSLDIARPQVLIEAIITELSAQQTDRLGGQIGTQLDSAGVPVINDRNFKNLIGAFTGTSFAFGYRGSINTRRSGGTKQSNPIYLLIQALDSDDNTRIIATPSIVTLNNEKAVINIAEERSVLKSDVSNADVQNKQNFERLEFGTKLTVTPQVTAGDNVRLDIDQVNSRVISGQGTDRPVNNKREIKTNVVVKNGEILVLGGLTQNNQREQINRVPWLSEIPLLGFLFKDNTDTDNKTNLMIFIKPTIIKVPEDGLEITKEQYAKMRLEQLLQLKAEYGDEKPDSKLFLLPPYEELGLSSIEKKAKSQPTPKISKQRSRAKAPASKAQTASR